MHGESGSSDYLQMNWCWVAALRNMTREYKEPAYLQKIKAFNPACNSEVPDDLKDSCRTTDHHSQHCLQAMDI